MTETWGDEMKIKGIIFDFDGTIADTLPICLHSFRRVFHEFDDRSLTDQEIKAMFGPSEVGIIELNLRRKEFVPQAIEAYYAHYQTSITGSLRRMQTSVSFSAASKAGDSNSAYTRERREEVMKFPAVISTWTPFSTRPLPVMMWRNRNPTRKDWSKRWPGSNCGLTKQFTSETRQRCGHRSRDQSGHGNDRRELV